MIFALALALAVSAEAKTAAERLAGFEASFERTGETERCLSLHRIRDTRVVDERHILFRIGARAYYVNTLPHACGALTVDRGFVIGPELTRLCDVDWITVVVGPVSRDGPVQGPSCGLGQFERVEKIDARE